VIHLGLRVLALTRCGQRGNPEMSGFFTKVKDFFGG
jgi:hypothetical protein